MDLKEYLGELRGMLWDREKRAVLQQHGMTVSPANFYASIPSIQEVMDSFEYVDGSVPYLDPRLFDAESMRAELASLLEFSGEFDPPVEGDEASTETFYWNNPVFSFNDAMSLYCYVRRIKPKTIVEIGSGFSSLVSLEALQRNGSGRLLCVEPYPRPFISSLGGKGSLELHNVRAQDITAEFLNSVLDDGDVLFIDSTHTVKSGSDCLHIYLRLLPYIERKIYVHVHDIFLPFGLPKDWLLDLQIYWTEQYLLLAFMIDNPRVRVLYGGVYHMHLNRQLLLDQMHGRARSLGASFWFEYDGRKK